MTALSVVPDIEEKIDWRESMRQALGYAVEANRQVLGASRAIADAVKASGQKWKQIKEDMGEFAALEAKQAVALADGIDAIPECQNALMALPTPLLLKVAKLAGKNPDAARAIADRVEEFSAQEISKICTAGKRMPEVADPDVLLGGIRRGALVWWTDSRVYGMDAFPLKEKNARVATVMATVETDPQPDSGSVRISYYSKWSSAGRNGLPTTAVAKISDLALVPYKLEGRADELLTRGDVEYLAVKYDVETDELEAIAKELRETRYRKFCSAPEIEYEIRDRGGKPRPKSEVMAELAKRSGERGDAIDGVLKDFYGKFWSPAYAGISRNPVRKILGTINKFGIDHVPFDGEKQEKVKKIVEDAFTIVHTEDEDERPYVRVSDAELAQMFRDGNGAIDGVTVGDLTLAALTYASGQLFAAWSMYRDWCPDFDVPDGIARDLMMGAGMHIEDIPTEASLKAKGLYGASWEERNPDREAELDF